MDLVTWCNRIIRWSFGFLFFLVPLILTPLNYELFEYNKMMLTYAVTAVIVTTWIIKMIAQKEIKIVRTPLDIPIVLFFLSQLVSSFFSMDPHVSWFGYYSRFNGGMISVISYILLYYAFVSNELESHLVNLLKVLLASAVIVSLYAALEHFGHSISCLVFTGKFDVSCWVQDVQNRVFATLGQPNWLAAFVVALIPVSLAFTLTHKFKQLGFWVWSVVSILFFAVLLFTKSRSGLVGLAIADIIFWVFLLFNLSFPRTRESIFNKKNIILPLLFLHVAFAAIIFFVGTNIDFLDKYITLESILHRTTKTTAQPTVAAPKTDTLLTTGGTESGVIRKYVWEGAVAAWKSSTKTMLIGTGTETFAFAFFRYKPLAHNLTSEWDFLYNKAHNEYLNYLATTGIFGLGIYLLFIGTFVIWYVSRIMTHDTLTLDTALFAGWISILVTNFFGFSVVIIQLLFFLFPAIIFVTNTKSSITLRFNMHVAIARFLSFSILLALLVLLVLLSRLWFADTQYAKGHQYNQFGQLIQARTYLSSAIALNPIEPVYYDEDSVVLAQLAVSELDTAHDATTAAILAKQSLAESDKAITISPNNVNFWKTRTKIFYAFSSFDPQFTTAAIEALSRAFLLSPVDPKITYNLAILYGKTGDNQKAIDTLKTTIALKPNYRDAYAALVIFYKETKQPNLAKDLLNTYLTKVDPNDKDFSNQLKTL